MGFSGTFEGILRGKKHYFQMEWIDVHQGFEFVDSGYNVTVIEGGKPYIVWITEDQMTLLVHHHSLRARVMGLRAAARIPIKPDKRLRKFMAELSQVFPETPE